MTVREFTGDKLHIDGRQICYRLVTAADYLKAVGWTDDQVEQFQDESNEIYSRITQIMALKQSCFLLRRTSHSCGSLSDGLYSLKMRLIRELRDDYAFEFDDDLVERDGGPPLVCKCGEPMIRLHDGRVRHGTYGGYGTRADRDHQAEAIN